MMANSDKHKGGDKVVSFLEKKRKLRPFYPMTGNPENGNYMDFARHLAEIGELETSKTPLEK